MVLMTPKKKLNPEEAGYIGALGVLPGEDRSPEAEQADFEPMPAAGSSMTDIQDILSRFERIAIQVEQSKIQEYVSYLEDPKRLIRINLLMGIARGFGFAVGFALLTALVVYALQWVIRMNLPLISKFVADIFYLANQYLTLYGR